MLNLEHLEHFLITTKYLSITAAAEKLFLNQSTLSRQISALEAECRAPLFDRSGRTLRLTEAGLKLQEEAVQIIEMQSRVVESVRLSASRDAKRIMIHTMPGYFESVDRIYRSMRNCHPEIEIGFRHLQMSELSADLTQGTADFGVTYDCFLQPIRDNPQFAIHPLDMEGFVCLCSPEHDFATREAVTLEECMRANLLFGADFPLILRDKTQRDVYRPYRPYGNMETLRYRLMVNDGIIILPKSSATVHSNEFHRIPIINEELGNRIVLVYTNEKKQNPVCRYMLMEVEKLYPLRSK